MPGRSAKPALSTEAQTAYHAYEDYLQHELDLRPATVRNYLSDLQQFMAWFESQHAALFAPHEIATPTLTAYRHYLLNDLQRKPSTINRHLVSLKRYFAWAFDTQRINRNPAQTVKLVQTSTPRPQPMSDADEHQLMASVQRSNDLRDIALITLMLHTGLRVAEVCALTWEQVVLRSRSGYLKVWGKRQRYREVPLNSTARQALRDLRHAQGEVPSGIVFRSVRTKDALTTRAIGFIVKKYAQRANLDIHPHDLRHRFGYRMAQSTPLHHLAQIMGHNSLDTTLIYVQATKADLQNDVERIAWE